jgi:hypothetical protein
MINKRKLYSVALVSTAIILGLISIAGAASQLTPEITWSNPANIVYGTPLNSNQLNASASDSVSRAPVPGIYIYTPSLGTVLSVGTHTLQADFTPNDITNYSNASASVSINVIHGRPTHCRNLRPNHGELNHCGPNNGCYGGAFVPVV